MYSIDTNRSQSLVLLTFSGWMEQDHKVFFGELMQAAAEMRAETGEWNLLVDFSDTPVMPQERAQNTAKIFEWCLANGIGRIAFVVSTITQRMQIQRVTQRNEKIEFFDVVDHAHSWLQA